MTRAGGAMDSAPDSGSGGCGFDSHPAHYLGSFAESADLNEEDGDVVWFDADIRRLAGAVADLYRRCETNTPHYGRLIFDLETALVQRKAAVERDRKKAVAVESSVISHGNVSH